METNLTTITLWQSYVRRGAPSNGAGNQTGYGRTEAEAHERAEHWNNQAPWARCRRVTVTDGAAEITESARHAQAIVGYLDGAYLPPTAEGARIVALARKGLYAQAVVAYFDALDVGVDLFTV